MHLLHAQNNKAQKKEKEREVRDPIPERPVIPRQSE